jgi:hypothetical protein
MKQDTNKDFKIKLIAGLIIFLILAMIVVWLIWGFQSITKFILIVFQVIMACTLLFVLAWLFWYLFLKKHAFDVNYVNKQRIIDAFTRIKRPDLKDLYLTGDKGHSRALVGSIIGYGRMQVLTRNYVYKETTDAEGKPVKEINMVIDTKGERVPQYTLEKQEQDVFIVKTKGLGGIFQDPMVIRVDPDSHDELVGDVNLAGFSIVPVGEYWYLNSDFLDVRKIDYAILKEAERTLATTFLSDVKELIDRATGIDAKHKKLIEGKSLVELPETSQVQGTNV